MRGKWKIFFFGLEIGMFVVRYGIGLITAFITELKLSKK